MYRSRRDDLPALEFPMSRSLKTSVIRVLSDGRLCRVRAMSCADMLIIEGAPLVVVMMMMVVVEEESACGFVE